MKWICIAGIILFLVMVAALLRLPHLAQRPMHGDEGVNADKFGTLLEQGRYEYFAKEFHGPTLYYLTLLSARLQGYAHYADITEIALRSVPAILGVILVAANFFLIPYIGFPAAASAALLMAISPAMVYYSRYYIHEPLLVMFSFGMLISGMHYIQNPRALWAVASGVFLGLMFATKETWIIVVASITLALILTLIIERGGNGLLARLDIGVFVRHLSAAFLAATAVSGLLISSFLRNPRGLIDFFLAYCTYFGRGLGEATFHVHPWYYYLKLLLYFHSSGKPVWTEGLIVLLAFLGIIACLTKKGIPGISFTLLRFLALYAFLMIAIYSLIPYKTPWCLLGFLHLLIILGGVGFIWLLQFFRSTFMKIAISALLAVAALHLGWQAWAESFRYEADQCNPYVYAHTTKDVFRIVRRLQDIAKAHPDGFALPIQVISRVNLWPLPFYLRRFSGVHWWNGVSDQAPNAPVILATPDMEPALARKFYELPPPGQREMYMNMFRQRIELRPQVELRGYIANSLWDNCPEMQENASAGSTRDLP